MMTAEPTDEAFPLRHARIRRGLVLFCDNRFPWITGLISHLFDLTFAHFPSGSTVAVAAKHYRNGIFLSLGLTFN